MEDLNVEYSEFDRMSEELSECAAAIKSDRIKINQYLSELNTYWKGNASENFNNSMEHYIWFFQECQKEIENDVNKLKQVKKAYQKFETHYLNRKI